MKKNFVLIPLIMIIFSIFSILSTVNANDLRWDLYFENIEIVDGSVTANQEAAIVGTTRSQITFDVTLRVPGDFYEFTVDAVNNGTVDAMIDEIGINRLTEEQKRYMTYDVTYSDGMRVKENDKLSAGTAEKLRIRVAFKEDINPADLPSVTTATMALTLNASYVQANENAVDRERNTIIDSNTTNTTNTTDNTNSTNNGSGSTNNNQGASGTTPNNGGSTNPQINNNNNNNGNNAKISNNGPIAKVVEKVKSLKMGDEIIKYVIILILAGVALALSFWKKDKDKDEDKK